MSGVLNRDHFVYSYSGIRNETTLVQMISKWLKVFNVKIENMYTNLEIGRTWPFFLSVHSEL